MHRLVMSAVFCVFTVVNAASAQEKLRFSSFDAPNLTPLAEQILTRAYEELDIRIETVKTSPRRALLDSSSGKTDGELVRIKDIGTRYESLVRVDVPIVVARTYAYAVNPALQDKSFEELKHLRIGHVAGARFAVDLAEGFTEIWTADTPEQLFEMLRHDRIDLVIAGEGTGQRLSVELGMPEVFPLGPSLHTVAFYHFLHESHADLVPEIENVLRRQLKRASGKPYEDENQGKTSPEKSVVHKTGMS